MKKIIVFAALLLLAFSVSAFAEDRFFEINAKKFSYTPNILRVNKGDNVKIRLISEDVHHGFYLDGYEIETSAHPGREGSLSFVADKKGKFNFRCSVTCGEFHPYMVGYIVVGPNSPLIFFVLLLIGLAISNLAILFFKKSKESENV